MIANLEINTHEIHYGERVIFWNSYSCTDEKFHWIVSLKTNHIIAEPRAALTVLTLKVLPLLVSDHALL